MVDPASGRLVATAPELGELVDHLRGSGRFAFDTEFVSESTFEPVLSLAQVATRERIAAIDALAVPDLAPLWGVVNDPSVEVVMHAAGEDLRIGKIQSGRMPGRVVDIQVSAGLVGLGYPLSLGNLMQKALGVSLAGGETRTDWRKRPLSPGQIRYALDDVRYLLDAADAIEARLSAEGRRDWAEAEYRGLLEAIRSREEDEDRWRRLPGLNGLNRRGLEAARLLSEWRREEARRSNRPVRQLLKDDLLVAIAKRMPADRRDLEALRDFNRPGLMAKSAEIVALVKKAQEAPAEDLPTHGDRRDDGPGSMVVSLLNAALGQLAAAARVAPALLGTTADLKDLVRWHVAGANKDDPPAILSGWRGEVCGRALEDVVAGRRSLRIVDPEAEVPVALDPIAGDRP